MGVLVVGVEDDASTGCVRMYLNHRSSGIYALVEDEAAQKQLRDAWAGSRHLLLTTPPPESVLFSESERP